MLGDIANEMADIKVMAEALVRSSRSRVERDAVARTLEYYNSVTPARVLLLIAELERLRCIVDTYR